MKKQLVTVLIIGLILLQPLTVHALTSIEAKQAWYNAKEASRDAQKAHRDAKITRAQCIKQKPTLRVSKKHELGRKVKLPPKIVHYEGSQDNDIAEYLMLRKLILKTDETT